MCEAYEVRWDFVIVIVITITAPPKSCSQELLNLPKEKIAAALRQFRGYVEHLVDSLLNVPNSQVLLPTIFPRFVTRFDMTNNVLEEIVRYSILKNVIFFKLNFNMAGANRRRISKLSD